MCRPGLFFQDSLAGGGGEIRDGAEVTESQKIVGKVGGLLT